MHILTIKQLICGPRRVSSPQALSTFTAKYSPNTAASLSKQLQQELSFIPLLPPMQHPSIILNNTTKSGTQHLKFKKICCFSAVRDGKSFCYKYQPKAIPGPAFGGAQLSISSSVKEPPGFPDGWKMMHPSPVMKNCNQP